MLGRVYLDRFEAIRLLGKGGMGTVFLARDQHEGGPAVVKVMHEHLASSPRFRQAFRQETVLMARLNHPNAVRVIAANADDPKAPFIVMEYAPGITLQNLLAQHKSFSPARVHRLLTQLCAVLQEAHERDIVHRDLKPANIVVSDPDTPYEKLKVLDFGLAELQQPGAGTGQSASGTRRTYGVGTPGYMSPEQVRDELVDGRADLYGVGVILYQLLTGKMPFPGDTPMAIFMSQATETPPSFADLGFTGPVYAGVEELILSCLSVDLDERPSSAAELLELYEEALREDEAEPEPEPEEALAPKNVDPYTHTEEFEAWMPEQIAQYKLKGFAEEVGGKVTASKPGVVRIRIPQGQASALAGLLSLFGRGTLLALSTPIDLELQMRKKDTAHSRLAVVCRLCLAHRRKLPQHPLWDQRLGSILKSLRSYLMVKE